MARIVETGSKGITYKKGEKIWNRGDRPVSYLDTNGERVPMTDEYKRGLMLRLLNGEQVHKIASEHNRSSAWVYHLYREQGYVIERSNRSMRMVHLTVAPDYIKQRFAADLVRPDPFPAPLNGIEFGKEIPFTYKSPEHRARADRMLGKTYSSVTTLPTDTEEDQEMTVPSENTTLPDDQYVAFMETIDIPLGQDDHHAGPPVTISIPLSGTIELVDDPADIEGQLRVAHQLQVEGMKMLQKLATQVDEYKTLLVISDTELTQLKAEKDQLAKSLAELVERHEQLGESFRKAQSKNITLQQDADHWRAHKLAEDRRKSVQGSKIVQEGNREYRQLLEKLKDKG